jgi:myo-inositol 2-dehydrogenase / D-chiro-inositol 1-dehydrogenase
MSHPPFQVALFGAGRIGNVHARNINDHPLSRLAYVVDPADGPAAALAEQYGARHVDETTALTDPAVDAILVASATSTHAELIEKGIAAGKAVFCEKPVDLSIARVAACLTAIAGATPPLFIGFNRRFDPGVAEVQRRAAAGAVGNIEIVNVTSKDPAGGLPIEYLKVSGGMFRDMTIHDFDMVRFLLGEEPVSVAATAASLVDPAIKAIGDIDTACVTLQCASGRIAIITNSRRASSGYDQRVEVHGATGTLRTENVPKNMFVHESADLVERANPKFFFTDRYAESYAAEWAHFVRCLTGEDRPNPSGVDGYRALLLAEAAYVSLREGRTVAVAEIEEALA